MDMHMIRWSMEVMVQGSRRRSTRHAVSPAISQADVLLWTADWDVHAWQIGDYSAK
jgi:hypothetical protein